LTTHHEQLDWPVSIAPQQQNDEGFNSLFVAIEVWSIFASANKSSCRNVQDLLEINRWLVGIINPHKLSKREVVGYSKLSFIVCHDSDFVSQVYFLQTNTTQFHRNENNGKDALHFNWSIGDGFLVVVENKEPPNYFQHGQVFAEGRKQEIECWTIYPDELRHKTSKYNQHQDHVTQTDPHNQVDDVVNSFPEQKQFLGYMGMQQREIH